jgi:hypothetical protein
MPRKLVAYKFSPEDLALIETVKTHSLASSNSEAIRVALRAYAERHGLIEKVRKMRETESEAASRIAIEAYEETKKILEGRGQTGVKGMAALAMLTNRIREKSSRQKPKKK